MENYSHKDSGDSAPHSPAVDEVLFAEERPPPLQPPPSTPAAATITYNSSKAKLMCSYGGKILPRPNDNKLVYVGGDTKILSVDCGVKFSAFLAKVTSLCGGDDVFVKYQLPGEDLDALISVTNDEDLEHLMDEHDRLLHDSTKPARLRVFLFRNCSGSGLFDSDDAVKPLSGQWFIDALNSVQLDGGGVGGSDGSVQEPQQPNQSPSFMVAGVERRSDFLLGPEKEGERFVGSAVGPTEPAAVGKDFLAKSDLVMGTTQNASTMRGGPQVVVDPRVFNELYPPRPLKVLEKLDHSPHAHIPHTGSPPAPVQILCGGSPPAPAPAHVHEMRTASGLQLCVLPEQQQPVYVIPTAIPGVYHAATLNVQRGQGYYQPIRNVVMQPAPPQATLQPQSVVQATSVIGGGIVHSEGIPTGQPGAGVIDQTPLLQVGYDSAGRRVYYTSTAIPYQASAAAPPVDSSGSKVVGGTGGNNGDNNSPGAL